MIKMIIKIIKQNLNKKFDKKICGWLLKNNLGSVRSFSKLISNQKPTKIRILADKLIRIYDLTARHFLSSGVADNLFMCHRVYLKLENNILRKRKNPVFSLY